MQWLIVGLGNPGYDGTRHNVGFDVVTPWASSCKRRDEFQSEVNDTTIAGTRCLVVRPQTFMNRSGDAVGALVSFYKFVPDQVVVAYDEIDLPLGTLRVKKGGGDAGHNGAKSVTQAIGPEYIRVRLGVGRPPDPRFAVEDWVLSKFSAEERGIVDAMVDRARAAIEALFTEPLLTVQNRFHSGP